MCLIFTPDSPTPKSRKPRRRRADGARTEIESRETRKRLDALQKAALRPCALHWAAHWDDRETASALARVYILGRVLAYRSPPCVSWTVSPVAT